MKTVILTFFTDDSLSEIQDNIEHVIEETEDRTPNNDTIREDEVEVRDKPEDGIRKQYVIKSGRVWNREQPSGPFRDSLRNPVTTKPGTTAYTHSFKEIFEV